MMSNELEWEVNAFFIWLPNEESDKTSASFDLTRDHFMGGTSADLKRLMILVRALLARTLVFMIVLGYA